MRVRHGKVKLESWGVSLANGSLKCQVLLMVMFCSPRSISLMVLRWTSVGRSLVCRLEQGFLDGVVGGFGAHVFEEDTTAFVTILLPSGGIEKFKVKS